MSTSNLYLFTGTAEIFIKNRIQRILSSFDNEQVTIIKYDMETESLDTILADACTMPFLEDRKIIILRNPSLLKEKVELTKDIKAFIKYLKNPPKETIMIIDATNINLNQSNEIVKTLKLTAEIIDYSNSEEIEIKGWIKRTCSTNDIEITDSAVELFLEYINSDQVRMVNELEKMIDYVDRGGIIDEKVVKLLVSKDLSKEVFNLIKAIINQDVSLANEIYQILSAQTKDVSGIISMISNSFKELLTTSLLLKAGYGQNDIARMYGVSNGRAYYIIKDAKNFKSDVLKEYIVKMADLDYKIKSGKIDKNIGIELLLLQL